MEKNLKYHLELDLDPKIPITKLDIVIFICYNVSNFMLLYRLFFSGIYLYYFIIIQENKTSTVIYDMAI